MHTSLDFIVVTLVLFGAEIMRKNIRSIKMHNLRKTWNDDDFLSSYENFLILYEKFKALVKLLNVFIAQG